MSPETAQDVGFETENRDGVLTLSLDRPVKKNALTADMLLGVSAAVRSAEKDDSIRLLVLTGKGTAFSAGAESDAGDNAPERFGRALYDAVRRIRVIEKPVVCVINGEARGAGMALALACDIRLCSAGAKLVPDFVESGRLPCGGLTDILVRSLGRGKALEHAWTGRPISANAAEQAGLVERAVPSDELASAAEELCRKLAKAPAQALALTKRAVNRAASGFHAQLDYEASLQKILLKN